MVAGGALGSVQIRHGSPGRLRLETGRLRGAPPGLVASLQHYVESLPGIRRATIGRTTGTLLVEFDPRQLSPAAILRELSAWRGDSGTVVAQPGGGLACSPCGPSTVRVQQDGFQPRDLPLGTQVILTAVAGLIAAGMMLKVLLFGRSRFAQSAGIGTVAALTTIISGYPIFRAGLEGLTVEHKLNNDLLITVASLVAVVLKESWTGLVVIFLVNLSNLFQALTLDRSRRAIREMLAGGERRAMILVDGVEVEVGIEEVRVGDILVIRAGGKIQVDGRVVLGSASVNQAPITGESVPVAKAVGDEVYAGSLIELGYLHVAAERVGDDTTVGRIIHLVEEAATVRAPIQNKAERFADRFVPISLFAATAFFLITWDVQLTLTILIIACPCAAGLSTPTAVSAALGNAARRGILIKGGNYLEAMGGADVVLFDKTGTLTEGRPEVTDVIALHGRHTPEAILTLAAAAETRSTHPLARAVLQAAQQRGLTIPPVEAHEVVIGQGVRARLLGFPLIVGSARLLEAEGIGTAHAEPMLAEAEEKGRSVLLVGYAGQLVGVLAVADRLRPESPEAVRLLRAAGIGLIGMLTGDRGPVAEGVGQRLGLDRVWAELLPDQKRAVIAQLQQEGRRVVMVGEGINDSPALAYADIGIALGTGGTDVAIEAADIVLAGDDPRKVAGLIHLSRRTLQVIHQNFAVAIGINSVGLVLGLSRLISPFAGAVLHNLATLGVVMNSGRILLYRDWEGSEPPPPEPQGSAAGPVLRTLSLGEPSIH